MNSSNFIVVLVDTQHGGNLGAAARAGKSQWYSAEKIAV